MKIMTMLLITMKMMKYAEVEDKEDVNKNISNYEVVTCVAWEEVLEGGSKARTF